MMVAWCAVLVALAGGLLLAAAVNAGSGGRFLFDEVIYFAVFLAFVFVALTASALTELEMLTPGAMLFGLGGFLGLSVLTAMRSGIVWGPRSGWSSGGALLVVGLALVLTWGASEHVIGGQDPGAYVAMGGNAARRGTTVDVSSAIAELGPQGVRDLVVARGGIAESTTILPGTYLTSPETGRIEHQFLHTFPAVLAFGHFLGGMSGLLRVTVFCGLCSVFALFLLARRAAGGGGLAIFAALLLATNLGHIYFARNPFSESPAQMVILTALWLTTLSIDSDSSRLGFVAGLLWGLSALFRIDSYLTFGPLLLAGSWLIGSGASRWFTRGLVPGLALGVGGALAFTCAFSWAFYIRPHLKVLVPLWLASTGLAVGAAGLSCAWRTRMGAEARNWVYASSRGILLTVGLMLTLISLWGYFLRPLGEREIVDAPVGHYLHQVASMNEDTFVRLAWYISPLGLCLAIIGIIGLLRDHMVGGRRALLAWWLVGLTVTGFYLWKQRVAPMHFWAFRRMIPVALPFVCVSIAWVLSWLWSVPRRGHRALAIGLAAGLVGWSVHNAWPFLWNPEMKGAVGYVARMASYVPKNGVLLAWPDTKGLASALRSLEGVDVVPLGQLEPPAPALENAINVWRARGREVLVATSANDDVIWPLDAHPLYPLVHLTVSAPRSHETKLERPRTLGAYERTIVLSRVGDGPVPARSGSWANPGSYSGFHATERWPEGDFRWTSGKGRIVFHTEPTVDRLSVQLALAGRTSVRVQLILDNVAHTQELIKPFTTIDVPMTPSGLGRHELTIKSDTFSPGELDTRALGVAVGVIRAGQESLSPRPPSVPQALPVTIHVERLEDLDSQGFYTVEYHKSVPFRWSSAESRIQLQVAANHNARHALDLSLGDLSGRPGGKTVQIRVGAGTPREIRVDAPRKTFSFAVDAKSAFDPLTISFRSEPWTPEGTRDTRQLGFVLWGGTVREIANAGGR